ncbi:MAG: DUF4271 domain-containing protein [Prevotellaceae bacterium]|jgi:hypothetical protein|nr:DUF4271 domain-containing protein [Prevotellaceae bacterium]
MISDTLTNNIMADTGSFRISAESEIFGENSVAYNRVSEISETKTVNNYDQFVGSGIAAGLCIYFLCILFFIKYRFSNIHKMFIDYRFARKQYEETTRLGGMNISGIILFTITVCAIQFSLLNNYAEYKMTLVPFLALSGIFTLQSAGLKLVAWVCRAEYILGEIHLNRKLYFGILGIIILPTTVLSLLYEGTEVEETALAVSKILSGLLIILMLSRLFKVFSEAKVSYFFRFLYLCTFELSPYLALFIVF